MVNFIKTSKIFPKWSYHFILLLEIYGSFRCVILYGIANVLILLMPTFIFTFCLFQLFWFVRITSYCGIGWYSPDDLGWSGMLAPFHERMGYLLFLCDICVQIFCLFLQIRLFVFLFLVIKNFLYIIDIYQIYVLPVYFPVCGLTIHF